jgi:trimeric autotransporter adhesin
MKLKLLFTTILITTFALAQQSNRKSNLINDSCAGALSDPNNNFPFTYISENGNMSTNNQGFVTTCPDGMNDGEWFSFVGTGLTISIDIYFVSGNYNPEIGVYTGTCNDLTCKGSADDFGVSGEESLFIESVLGVQYFVNVGNNSYNVDNQEGNFTITIDQVLENDQCINGYYINSFPYVFAQENGNLASNNNGNIAGCFGSMNDGVWFKFIGNGNLINVRLGNVESTYNPEIAVYTGFCNGLSCVVNADDLANDGIESLTFSTLVGAEYYINIGNVDDVQDLPEGDFTIVVCEDLINDACNNGRSVITMPYSFTETNGAGANFGSYPTTTCSNNPMNDGEWFGFTGTGGNVLIRITNISPDYDVQIGVYKGECINGMTCEGTVDDFGGGMNESIIIPTTMGDTYSVNIGERSDNENVVEGNFKIEILDATLSNESFDANKFKIYPNPTTTFLNIENSEKISKIKILNLLGLELKQQNSDDLKSQIDISDLSNGTYFIQIITDDKEQIAKFIKN